MIKKGILVVVVVILLSLGVLAINLPNSPSLPDEDGNVPDATPSTDPAVNTFLPPAPPPPSPSTDTEPNLPAPPATPTPGATDTPPPVVAPKPTVTREVAGTNVKLTITSEKGFILTDRVTSGIQVSSISDGGKLNTASGEIKWILTLPPSQPLTYAFTGSGSVTGKLTTIESVPQIIDIPKDSLVDPTAPNPFDEVDDLVGNDDFSGFTDALGDDVVLDELPQLPGASTTPTPSLPPETESGAAAAFTPPPPPPPSPRSDTNLGQAVNVPVQQTDTSGLDEEISEEFDTAALPGTITDEEKQVLFIAETEALAKKTRKSHTGGIIFFMLLIAVLAGGGSYYFIMEKVHGNIPHQHFHKSHKKRTTEATHPGNHNQMIYLLSYYISTNLKNGFSINQLFPMMKAQGYSDVVIKQAYAMAMKKWT